MTTAQKVTAEELLQMPDDGLRYELVKGELVKMAPAGSEHGDLAMRVGWRLGQYVENHNLGKVFAAETGFRIASNPDTVRAPDVAFISKGRVEEAGLVEGYWPGAPDLAVEVISPTDIYTAVQAKVLDWLDAGTLMVAVVNPRQQTVTVYRSRTDITILTGNDILDGQDVVPGWTLVIRDFFA
ncbi:MAG: Uma2 family endonuclease [Chloroflexi bacterium]|nr:Uma2 family endonuclease [Chloroflexota bacterium]